LLISGERAHVFFAGAQKIQKVQTRVFACLTDTQENQVLFNPLGRRETLDRFAESRKGFDRMLGIVVVPGDSVMA
jgi:hypothetical protein